MTRRREAPLPLKMTARELADALRAIDAEAETAAAAIRSAGVEALIVKAGPMSDRQASIFRRAATGGNSLHSLAIWLAG